jgi:hypothetical protein
MAAGCELINDHDIDLSIDAEISYLTGAGQVPTFPRSTIELRNIRMMHLLERVAVRFNEAGLPLMALKGAALNLTIHAQPGDRPMGDLDLMVRPQDVDKARELLEDLGCLRGEPLVREDFFPRYYYETDYRLGAIHPVRIDLHVRPFRPLRYGQLVPVEALWQRALTVRMVDATLQIPCPDDMLIHLATHAAIHGLNRTQWLDDIRHWIVAHERSMDWDRFMDRIIDWRLVLPVREALVRVEHLHGGTCPATVLKRLSSKRVSWRDRLVLYQAPRDDDHPVAHVVVNALCTPGLRFVASYLWAVAWPDQAHMADWYSRRHVFWLPTAHALRCLQPVIRRLRPLWSRLASIETRPSRIHGTGVFATKNIKPGKLIARYHGRPVDRDGTYVGYRTEHDGMTQRYEITGPLRFLNHSCRPNAGLSGFELVALRPITAGEEILIDYGPDACTCRQHEKVAAVGSAAVEHAA